MRYAHSWPTPSAYSYTLAIHVHVCIDIVTMTRSLICEPYAVPRAYSLAPVDYIVLSATLHSIPRVSMNHA